MRRGCERRVVGFGKSQELQDPDPTSEIRCGGRAFLKLFNHLTGVSDEAYPQLFIFFLFKRKIIFFHVPSFQTLGTYGAGFLATGGIHRVYLWLWSNL